MSSSKETPPNSARGRTSRDSVSTGSLIPFLNRSASTYPTEVGAPKFELVAVTKEKDIMLNVARMHAQQEYDRIMDLVTVLQDQAAKIKRRLEITDLVHAAEYNFKCNHNEIYWLLNDRSTNKVRLSMLGPADWGAGAPDHYEYICRVKWLGDYTWMEIDNEGNYAY